MNSPTKRMAVTAALVAVFLCGTSEASELSISIKDVSVIQDQGRCRVLFRLDSPPDFRTALVRRAQLEVPFSVQSDLATSHYRLFPINQEWGLSPDWTGGWTQPGGDFDGTVYARAEADVSRRSGTLSFDMTHVMKSVFERGTFADGFLITSLGEDGGALTVNDLPALAGLSAATVDVSYRTVLGFPPGSPRREGLEMGRREGSALVTVIGGDR